MYVIKHNGSTLYSPAVMGMEYKAMAPKLELDINSAGSCSFTLPPGNRQHSAIRRRKSIITVEQDGREIFRGRVLDDEIDQYNQRRVYAEGVRSYLNDSQAAPYTYTGTPRGLFRKLIGEHNDQIEQEKRFVVGQITIDRAGEALECENVEYWETFREIEEKLLNVYGGYLRVRNEDGIQYIDWIKEYSSAGAPQIRFSVNLIDLKDKNDSSDVFTLLRPLGASEIGEDGEYGDPITIASVNGGKDYIEDAEAVAKYGRIWRSKTWAYEEDPAKLKEKALEYMKIGAELRTITLQAIDMHFLDGSIDAIRVGGKVHIVSEPHGINLEKVCCKIAVDMANPEKTTYVFGEPPRTLTENIAKQEKDVSDLTGSSGGGGGRRSVKQEMNGILRWAKIQIEEANGKISMNAGEVNSLTGRMSQAEIDILGALAQIRLKASQEEVTDLGMRMSAAGIDIRGDIANIKLFATQETVNDLGQELSEAWLEIDGMNKTIRAKADRIELDAYVTAAEFATLKAEIANMWAGVIEASTLQTQNLIVTGQDVRIKGHSCKWLSKTVCSGGSVSKSSIKEGYDVLDGGVLIGKCYVPNWTFKASGQETIYYLGYD